MIATIRGKMVYKTPTSVILDVSGVGFQVLIPLSSFNALGEVGDEVQLITHLHVREDALQLFGFITQEERWLFTLLISVSGVGPKLAQGVLSGISVGDFQLAVQREDSTALSRVPGIGKKTAERLIVELRDKMDSIGEEKRSHLGRSSAHEEAVLALCSLGYKRNKAEDVIHKLLNQDSSLSIEEVIRRALRTL